MLFVMREAEGKLEQRKDPREAMVEIVAQPSTRHRSNPVCRPLPMLALVCISLSLPSGSDIIGPQTFGNPISL